MFNISTCIASIRPFVGFTNHLAYDLNLRSQQTRTVCCDMDLRFSQESPGESVSLDRPTEPTLSSSLTLRIYEALKLFDGSDHL